MIEHMDLWIDAYLDDELDPRQRQQVDAHLSQCPVCRRHLEQRRSLSGLLQEVPPASTRKTENQFVAEVGMRLSRRQVSTNPGFHLAWSLTPVALVLAAGFIQTAFILYDLVGLIPGAEQFLVNQPTFAPLSFHLPGLASKLLEFITMFLPMEWSWIIGLAGLVAIGLMYLGWLAAWWSLAPSTKLLPDSRVDTEYHSR